MNFDLKNQKSINQFKSPKNAQNFSKTWLKNLYRSGFVEYPSVSLTESRAAGSTSVWRHSVVATVEHHLEKQHSKDASIIEHGWETFKKLKKNTRFLRDRKTHRKTKWWSKHFFFRFQTFGNWSGPAPEKAKYEIDEEK